MIIRSLIKSPWGDLTSNPPVEQITDVLLVNLWYTEIVYGWGLQETERLVFLFRTLNIVSASSQSYQQNNFGRSSNK